MSPSPTFIIHKAKSYSRGMGFCITPISPKYGGGLLGNYIITNPSDPTVIWTPNWINYRGVWILGQKMTASHNTGIGFNANVITSSDGAYTGDYSIMILCDIPSFSSYRRVLVQGNWSTAAPAFEVLGNYASATGNSPGTMTVLNSPDGTNIGGYADSIASVIDGQVHCWTFRRKGGAYRIYRDGIDVTGTTSNSTAAMSYSGGTLSMGGLTNGSEDAAPNCTMALAAGWNRALSDTEMNKLGVNPFDLFIDYSSLNRFIFQSNG